MAHNFQRPNLPYDANPLPNNSAFVILENLKRPVPGILFDSTFNYVIDSMNQLDTDIINVVAGIIPGTDDPNNNKTVLSTLGESDQNWIKITGDYVEDESLPGSKLIPLSVGPEQIADGAITDDKVADGGLSLDKVRIEDGGIPFDKIGFEENTIDGKYLKTGTVAAGKIRAKDISQAQLGLLSVGTGELIDNSVTLAKLAAVIQNALPPIGSVIEYSGTVAPSANWLECNGQLVSRTTYAALFTAIGATYGAGDGSTTFALEDRRGRTAIGIGSDNSTGGRVTAATASSIILGGTFGAERHQLTVAELASHNHQMNLAANTVTPGAGGFTEVVSFGRFTDNTGGDQPHNNMQPGIFKRFYVRAL